MPGVVGVLPQLGVALRGAEIGLEERYSRLVRSGNFGELKGFLEISGSCLAC